MRRILWLLVVWSCAATGVVPCAASGWLEPGMRVRVSTLGPERGRWAGPLVSIARDTLMLHDSEMGLVPVPTLQIKRLEISRGDFRSGARGAAWGLAIGALMGAVIGYLGYRQSDFLIDSAGENAAFGACFVGAIGLTAGTAVGVMTPSERWAEMPLDTVRARAQR